MGEAKKGRYRRSPERGFRKFAMAFWRAPNDGVINGHMIQEVTRARQFQASCEAKFGYSPSIGMLVGRALAETLKKVPEGNAKIIWGQAYLKDTVDVYFQVDVGDGQDLSGVVVEDVGAKTAMEVADSLRLRAKKLREGQDEQYEKTQKGCMSYAPSWILRPLLGIFTFLEYNLGITPTFLGARKEPFGTIMVTNVSKFGIDIAYAPLVPVSRVPFLTLVGQVSDQPWVRDGELVVAPVVPLAATFDHRLLDGNKIGRIVRGVRHYMDDPFAYEAEALGLEVPPMPFGEPGAAPGEAAPSEDAGSATAPAGGEEAAS